MKINATPDLSNLTEISEVTRFGTRILKQLFDALNGNLTVADNFKWDSVSVEFGTADTEVQVVHTLGQVPNGYILAGATVAMSLFDGDTANTTTELYIKSNAVGTATVLIF